MKTILITGGSGFIGKNLYEHLQDKYFRDAPTHKFLDLTNAEEVAEFFKENGDMYSAVIHCAGRDDPRCFQDNAKMLINLKANVKCKILLLGSGADNRPDGYGMSKMIALNWATSSPNVSYLRLYGVFGKYEDVKRRFISLCIKMKLNGGNIIIAKNRILNYIPVEDVCQMIENWIETKLIHSVYVPEHPDSMSLTEIAHYVGVKYVCEDEVISDIYEPEESDDLLIKKYTPLRAAIDALEKYYGGGDARHNRKSVDDKASDGNKRRLGSSRKNKLPRPGKATGRPGLAV
jgi:nucleoside-diphosphate-sugar epimerase